MANMSLYPRLTETDSELTVSLEELYTIITGEQYKEKVLKIRKLPSQLAKKLKAELPAITSCGTFKVRKDDYLLMPSNIICIDIDKCPDVSSIKQQLIHDQHAVMLFISPSGNGLKVLFNMAFGYNKDIYKARYVNACKYISEKYNIPIISKSQDWGIDSGCSNLSRACYLSFDPEAYYNDETIEFTQFNSLSNDETKLNKVITEIEDKGIDITSTYEAWFSIGCALNHALGSAGKDIYQSISKYHSNYNFNETEAKYAAIQKSGNMHDSNRITLGSLFSIAKDNGIGIYIPKPIPSIEEDDSLDTIITDKYKDLTFPVDAFPDPIKDFIVDSTKSIGCPDGMVGAGVLAIVSVAIGAYRTLKIHNDYFQTANLYIAILGGPGTKKTPAKKIATKPLITIQRKLNEVYNSQMVSYNKAIEAYEVAKNDKSIKNKPPKPEEPKMQLITATDFTMEALHEKLLNNPKGMLYSADELTAWINSMNQYKSKGADVEHWLSFWTCEDQNIIRKGKEAIILERPFVSVYGNLTPDNLYLLKGKVNNGFIERILFVYPNEQKRHYSASEPNEEVINIYCRGIVRIYDQIKSYEPVILSPEAKKVLDEYMENEHYIEMNDPNLPYLAIGFWSKLETYAFRFTLLLYSLRTVSTNSSFNDSQPKAVDALGAIQLLKYFKATALKVIGELYSSPEDKQILKAVAWLKRNNDTGNIRIFYKAGIAGIRTAKAAMELFSKMEERELGVIFKEGKSSFFQLKS